MAKPAPTRLVEGPLCKICGGGLDINETKMSEGAQISHIHRDAIMRGDHKPIVVYKVIRP